MRVSMYTRVYMCVQRHRQKYATKKDARCKSTYTQRVPSTVTLLGLPW